MSSSEDTTGKLRTDWEDSPEYQMALTSWWPLANWSLPQEESQRLFMLSVEFCNARHAYRKRINQSWDKEST